MSERLVGARGPDAEGEEDSETTDFKFDGDHERQKKNFRDGMDEIHYRQRKSAARINGGTKRRRVMTAHTSRIMSGFADRKYAN